MKVLRVCRTLPSINNPGAGMHCYKYTILSKYKSVILTKENIGNIKPFPNSVPIYQMKYQDITAKSSELKLLNYIAIGISKLWGELICLKEILKILRNNNFSFIHIHSINYLIAGVLAKKIFKIPIGLNLGGTDFQRAKNIWLYRFLLKQVDKLFFVSLKVRDELLEIVDEEVLVHTSNGFNSEIFFNTNQTREEYLIAVGNLRWQKNHTLLLESFVKVVNEFPNIQLIIIGSGPEREKLQNLSIDLKIQSQVHFYGQLKQDEIAEMMNKSKIFCLTSSSEGFPKVILEAFSCGLPVISTDVGDCRNIIKDGGVISESNPDDYSNNVINLLKDNNFIKYQEKALKISENYSWYNVVNKIDQAYDSLKFK